MSSGVFEGLSAQVLRFSVSSERRRCGATPLEVVVSSQRGIKIRGAKAVVWYSAIRLAISAAVSSIPREIDK